MSKRLFVIVFLLCTEKSVCKHTKRLTTESSRRPHPHTPDCYYTWVLLSRTKNSHIPMRINVPVPITKIAMNSFCVCDLNLFPVAHASVYIWRQCMGCDTLHLHTRLMRRGYRQLRFVRNLKHFIIILTIYILKPLSYFLNFKLMRNWFLCVQTL